MMLADRCVSIRCDRRAEIRRTAAWHAAQVHLAYRRNGGTMSATLPDFFIGAHAQVERWSLLTRIRTYFPDVILIAPSE